MMKGTLLPISSALICMTVLLCMFYLHVKRFADKPVYISAPRVLLNKTFVSNDFPDSYTYVYTNPLTGEDGIPMTFFDEKSLQHIKDVNSIVPVDADDYVGRVPQVVTYSSENHWSQTDSHLPTILEQFDSVVIYSMGLKDETIANATEKYGSKIMILKFDPSGYPPHMHNLKIYAFKGAIWADAIVRFGWCLFLDASVFLTGNVMTGLRDSMFKEEKNDRVCFKYVIADAGHDIFMATRVNLYDYFPVPKDQFEKFNEFKAISQQQSGGFSVLPTAECLTNFIKPVLMCSLYKDCIALPGATLTGKTRHRYDQSLAHTLVGNMYNFHNKEELESTPKEYVTLRRNLAALVCRAEYGCSTPELKELCGEREGPIKRAVLKTHCV